MSQDPTSERSGVSIVCVFNNLSVREECLDRSIEAYQGSQDVEYIPVDNRTHAFTSAGAALNHGARQAQHSLVVFVHQDVYLHSIDRLVEAGQSFDRGAWGVLGANGVTAEGLNVGRLRDRTQLIGVSAKQPVEVHSLDEVLFMVPRELVLEHPLTESDEFAWHAYGVEYCLRLRMMGLQAGAVDLAVTHNSLTVNLARLDVAHRSVGREYPQFVPIHTTCGTIGGKVSRLKANPVVRRHGWRLRWLRQSWLAARARRVYRAPVVFSDIRHDVDLLSLDRTTRVQLINVDPSGGFVDYVTGSLELTRYGRSFTMRTVGSVLELEDLIHQLTTDDPVLIVGIRLDELRSLTWTTRTDRPWLLGIHPGEMWLLGGLRPDQVPDEWSKPEAVPLGHGLA